MGAAIYEVLFVFYLYPNDDMETATFDCELLLAIYVALGLFSVNISFSSKIDAGGQTLPLHHYAEIAIIPYHALVGRSPIFAAKVGLRPTNYASSFGRLYTSWSWRRPLIYPSHHLRMRSTQ